MFTVQKGDFKTFKKLLEDALSHRPSMWDYKPWEYTDATDSSWGWNVPILKSPRLVIKDKDRQ